tara:strand:+ start:25564 stop:25722 length:159 start_codon:yes stop_codon:yes gene_type:complete
MKYVILLVLFMATAAPYCVDNKTTVGDIAKDVSSTTNIVIDEVQNKASKQGW